MSVFDLCGENHFCKIGIAGRKHSRHGCEHSSAHPILLVFSLFALPLSSTGGGRAQSPAPLSKKLSKIFLKAKVKFLPLRGVLVSVMSTECGVRTAGATLISIKHHFNICVRADIEALTPPYKKIIF